MEGNVEVQLNIIAICLIFITIAIVVLAVSVVFIVAVSYLKFSRKIDDVLENIKDISSNVNHISNFVTSEVDRAKNTLDDVHSAFTTVSYSLNTLSNMTKAVIQNINIANMLRSLFSNFKGRKKSKTSKQQEF